MMQNNLGKLLKSISKNYKIDYREYTIKVLLAAALNGEREYFMSAVEFYNMNVNPDEFASWCKSNGLECWAYSAPGALDGDFRGYIIKWQKRNKDMVNSMNEEIYYIVSGSELSGLLRAEWAYKIRGESLFYDIFKEYEELDSLSMITDVSMEMEKYPIYNPKLP